MSHRSQPEIEIVLAWLPAVQAATIAEEMRLLASSILYADRVVVLCPESDDALELNDYFSLEEAFGEDLVWVPLDSTYAHQDGESTTYGPFDPEVWDRLKAEYIGHSLSSVRIGDMEGSARSLAKVALLDKTVDSYYDAREAAFSLLRSRLNPVELEQWLPQVEATYSHVDSLVHDELGAEVLAGVFLNQAQLPGRYAVVDDPLGRLWPLLPRGVGVGLSELAQNRSMQGSIAAGTIYRLPTPRNLRWDELADVRRRLLKPLVRFRSAMARLAEDVTHDPFAPSFDEYLDGVWHQHIAPALVELEDLCRDASLREVFFRDVLGDLKSYAGPLMGLAAASWGDISSLVATALGVATPVLSTAAHLGERQRTRRAHDYFFLHEVARAVRK